MPPGPLAPPVRLPGSRQPPRVFRLRRSALRPRRRARSPGGIRFLVFGFFRSTCFFEIQPHILHIRVFASVYSVCVYIYMYISFKM